MKCPNCGIDNPPQYDSCWACGAIMKGWGRDEEAKAKAVPTLARQTSSRDRELHSAMGGGNAPGALAPHSVRRRDRPPAAEAKNTPKMLGLSLLVAVLLILAGVTFFFVTKAPDDQRLYEQGQKELASSQYAFAVSTLTQASRLKPDDPKILLGLARAYIGIDQIDRAWDCINQAKNLGAGVAADPELATELASYYRQHGRCDRAIELLRPLAKDNVPGKRAELADLDAAWGDDLLRDGKLDAALSCWEEVRDFREGSRFSESEARLATIYQRLANSCAAKSDDQQALGYLNKLNNIAENSKNYEMAADIYLRDGKTDLAIGELRKASTLSSKNPALEKKLADLLASRGKELMDAGDTDQGLGFLQESKDLNPQNAIPNAILRNVNVSIERTSRQPRITGELFNPAESSLSTLVFKVELFDNANSRSLWSKEQRPVDEFTLPMNAHEAKSFDLTAPLPVKANGKSEFRTYIDGTLYKTYLIGEKDKGAKVAEKPLSNTVKATQETGLDQIKGPVIAAPSTKPKSKEALAGDNASGHDSTAREAAAAGSTPAASSSVPTAPAKSGSAEERTMKDLEF